MKFKIKVTKRGFGDYIYNKDELKEFVKENLNRFIYIVFINADDLTDIVDEWTYNLEYLPHPTERTPEGSKFFDKEYSIECHHKNLLELIGMEKDRLLNKKNKRIKEYYKWCYSKTNTPENKKIEPVDVEVDKELVDEQ